ncbi:MAG: DUF4465 domain-containing protein [Bacteroidia bacterium]|nr:DUF4465 domain-containing protein [Bacteroidia bacterium]
MKKNILIAICAFAFSTQTSTLQAQTPTMYTWGFEEFYQNGLDSGQVWNGSDGKKSIVMEPIGGLFQMELKTGWDTAWGGYWANNWILTAKDYTKEEPSDFMNHLYAVKPNIDNNNTGRVHAIGTQNAYLTSALNKMGQSIYSFQVANTTYAYNSMKLGDNIGKKFTSADNDTFVLIIQGYREDSIVEKQMIYLADFRLGINSYIANEWINVNMKNETDSITFSLVSSDNGDFGMNTPAYFALDNITLIGPASVKKLKAISLQSYPNPAVDQINFKNLPTNVVKTVCIDALGRNHSFHLTVDGTSQVAHLNPGMYWVEFCDIQGNIYRSSFIKN